METHSLNEFNEHAVLFARGLTPSAEGATVVTLSGDLGAGKTAFVRAVLRDFGVEEAVTSPTFVIEKVYVPNKGPFEKLVHIDAYRLKSARELEVLGWKEQASATNTLIFLEWPERVAELVPKDAIRVTLELTGGETRTISYGKDER